MRKSKTETNEEFIIRTMNFGCPTGAMIQPFIIEALTRYCEQVVRTPPEVFTEGTNGLLSGEAWVATAVWLEQQIKEKYSGIQEAAR